MTLRVCPPLALLAAALALSGCIDVECPAEFARPLSRERYCGHTGDVAAPAVYRPAVRSNPPPIATVTTTTTVVTPPGPPLAAPNPPVVVEQMPPPGGATQIR
jgi:hypothetical protein